VSNQGIGLIGHLISSRVAPRMTFHNSAQAKPTAFYCAMALQGLQSICAACGVIPAIVAHPRR